MRAATIVPLLGAGRALGTLSLVSAESGRSFGAADVELAEEVGRRAAVAIENARLYGERLQIARTLQSSLLPDALPEMPGWRAQTLYRPADSELHWVGGDFFDAVTVAGGWLVLVGDVSGHGAEAAALTALARHTLRAAAKALPDPLDAIAQLNDELVARRPLSLCTIGAALLRERDGHQVAEIVCAGHPQLLLVQDGVVRELGCFGPLLGAYATERWERVTVPVEPGAMLVLYTDGVLDTVGDRRERFGQQRLQRTLRGVDSPEAAIDAIDEALRAFQVGRQADDTAVLAVQRVGVATCETAPPVATDQGSKTA